MTKLITAMIVMSALMTQPVLSAEMEKGDCVKTTIAEISPYFVGETTYDSGINIEMKNGLYLTSRNEDFDYNQLARVELGIGDKVTMCLQYIMEDCPRDLTPHRVYHVINKTSGRVFTMADNHKWCY